MNEIARINWKKKTALSLFGQYRTTQAAIHDLTYLFWECTLRCNLSCLHCGSDCQRNSAISDMPPGDFLNVLDKIRAVTDPSRITLALTGGEPLLRADLEECGKEFHKRGFPWGMVTNGYGLTLDRYKRLLDASIGSITVSLDGMERSHNWLRGKDDSFEKAVNAVKMIVATRNLSYDVVTCVNQKNISELQEFKQMLCDIGVKRWRLFTIFPKGRAKNDKLLDISNEQFVELMEFIKDTRAQGLIDASYSCEGFLGNYEGEVRDGFFFCRAGINVASVLADGSMSACPSLRGDYIQGNIYKEDFWDVWNNRYDTMRNRKWTKTGECSKCKEFKWCNGNALHLRNEKTGDLLRCHYAMLKNEHRESFFQPAFNKQNGGLQ